jgi:hypothetical protein
VYVGGKSKIEKWGVGRRGRGGGGYPPLLQFIQTVSYKYSRICFADFRKPRLQIKKIQKKILTDLLADLLQILFDFRFRSFLTQFDTN